MLILEFIVQNQPARTIIVLYGYDYPSMFLYTEAEFCKSIRWISAAHFCSLIHPLYTSKKRMRSADVIRPVFKKIGPQGAPL